MFGAAAQQNFDLYPTTGVQGDSDGIRLMTQDEAQELAHGCSALLVHGLPARS